MREEFKFRAWHEETKTMHDNVTPWQWDFAISKTWHRCEKSTGPGMLGSGGNEAEFLVPGVRFDVVMQYTGMKDKSGKDIYEGDIISMIEVRDDSMSEYVTDIKWDDCAFVCKSGREDYDMFFGAWSGDPQNTYPAFEMAVIGNIYENPDLLK